MPLSRLIVATGAALAAVVLVAVPGQAAPAGSPAAPASVQGSGDSNDFRADPAYAKYYQQQLTWEPCFELNAIKHECASVLAPRNWYDPSIGDLGVRISRPVGEDGKPRGGNRLLFSNPGGPGGAGLAVSTWLTEALGLWDTHTPVGIDPRGIGQSTRLDCDGYGLSTAGGDGDSRNTTAAEAAVVLPGAKAWARKCLADNPTLMPYINTDQTVRDFNLVRQLFGARPADYYGISYGTWLGAYLKKSFPSAFERVVLDANMDWMYPQQRQIQWDPSNLQENFDRVSLPWLARHNDVYGLGTTAAAVNATFERLRAAAGQHKLFGMTPDQVDMLGSWGIAPSGLKDLGQGLSVLNRALNGDAQAAQDAAAIVEATARDANSVGIDGVYASVVCGDTYNEDRQSVWFAQMSEKLNRVPLSWAWGETVDYCAEWPVRPALDYGVMNRPLDAMLIHNELDPNTAYGGFLESVYLVKGSVNTVFVDNGTGHFTGANPHVIAVTKPYLQRGRRPIQSRIAVAGVPLPEDSAVYAYKTAASRRNPLPATREYLTREFVDPAPVPGSQISGPATQDLATRELEKLIGHHPWRR